MSSNNSSTSIGDNSTAVATRPLARNVVSWPTLRLILQIVLCLSFILAWEFLPRISFLSQNFKILDPFFISSPSAVWAGIGGLLTGNNDMGITLWPYLTTTVIATLAGTTAGLTLGACAGLLFSNSQRLGEVVRPFIVLVNSIPRVAIIPIIVVLAGATLTASIISVIAVVFFVGFFNAFEGGRSIPQPMLDNARLLGAGSFEVMRSIRLPMVLTWTFAAVPNAISFGLIVAVTTELLAGVRGMGTLLQNALANLQADLTFAVIVVLSIVGLAMNFGGTMLRNRFIHWQ